METFYQPIKLLILCIILAEIKCHVISEGSISDGDCGLYDEKQAKDTGKYPWEAMVFNKTDKDEWEYLCDGVLINSNTIVTAASCIQPKNSNNKIILENIKVEIGDVYNKTTSETHKKEFNLSGILTHDGWDVYYSRYSYDFAMLKLNDDIKKFNDFLRPICFKHSKNISDINFGSINGFNGTNFGIITNKYLQSLYSPHDTNDPEETESANELKKLAKLKGRESFIAGANSTGICPANIGSGFNVEFQGKIYLRGIVSSAGREEKFDCNQSGNAMFSDILKYFMTHQVIKFSKAKYLTREPVCRKNDDELKCSLELESFITRCTNDTNIWGQLDGRQLSSLNVSINGISEFCTQYFTKINSLTKLVIKSFSNVEIDVEKISKILSDFKQLKEFTSEGVTMTLQESIFAFNHNLEKIDICSGQLLMLPESLLLNNDLLKSFNVRGNMLTSIPEFLFSKSLQLEMIDLSENPIKALPEQLLINMKFLKVFYFEQKPKAYYDLSDSDSTDYLTIPEKIFNDTTALEEINLSFSKIKELPPGLLKNLELLKVVDFTQCKISFIPDDFFANNKNLEIIFMLKNEIKKLHENLLKNLPSLKLFDVRRNLIESIAEDFFSGNVKLEGIDLSENPIDLLPEILFEKLDSLKVLYLEDLSLKSIPADIIANNRKLEYINLSGNMNVSTIHDHLFNNNEELREIHMSSCGIKNLPVNLFKTLKVLKNVDMSNNKISSIPENFFSNNEQLADIDLNSNQIKDIPKTLLNGLTSLNKLVLSGNLIDRDFIIPENYFTENGEKAKLIFLIYFRPKIDPTLIRSLLG